VTQDAVNNKLKLGFDYKFYRDIDTETNVFDFSKEALYAIDESKRMCLQYDLKSKKRVKLFDSVEDHHAYVWNPLTGMTKFVGNEEVPINETHSRTLRVFESKAGFYGFDEGAPTTYVFDEEYKLVMVKGRHGGMPFEAKAVKFREMMDSELQSPEHELQFVYIECMKYYEEYVLHEGRHIMRKVKLERN